MKRAPKPPPDDPNRVPTASPGYVAARAEAQRRADAEGEPRVVWSVAGRWTVRSGAEGPPDDPRRVPACTVWPREKKERA